MEQSPNIAKPRRKPRNRKAHDSGSNDGAQRPLAEAGESNSGSGSLVSDLRSSQAGRNRRQRFNAGIAPSDECIEDSKPEHRRHNQRRQPTVPMGDDLASTLTRALSLSPYTDCLICFAPIHPREPTWSCSTATGSSECCWNTFHLKCIKAWAIKSTTEIKAAWRARGDINHPGEWRCPGCQYKREHVPTGYKCFCGSTVDPKPARLATPHSCANPCSRRRMKCNHPCSITCHPGPCPTCLVTLSATCHCGKQTISFRCGTDEILRTCGQICGRLLGCGKHRCRKPCHAHECQSCEATELVKCLCGKEEKELDCGSNPFTCAQICHRSFDCGKHDCQRGCHNPSIAAPPCPLAPSTITRCPCGKHLLDGSSVEFFPSTLGLTLPRKQCTDPIPTCDSTCLKILAHCPRGHVCSEKCHKGACGSCKTVILRTCRCGSAMKEVVCSTIKGDDEVVCDKVCGALLGCGKHRCTRFCCPLAAYGLRQTGAGKKKRGMASLHLEDGEDGGLHGCDLECGKLLACGSHHCDRKDHRGACGPCLASSFEEMICNCRRTILEPPIQCGTQIICSFPCVRPAPECGHPMIPHSCHESGPCPPCAVLTMKSCTCGKNVVRNVRCSQDRVGCGTLCGKLMECGYHTCPKLCHGDACGSCMGTCGKPRKECLPLVHPCPLPCHAPSSCPSVTTNPCVVSVAISCPCGRIQQSIPCASVRMQNLACTHECAIAKRNAKLAEALGISPRPTNDTSQPIIYADELKIFARKELRFLSVVEKTFQEFSSSDRKTQVLPHMPPERRQFVNNLAGVYRMDTQMIDQEPHRSVQLIRRTDTRIPKPLLSTVISQTSNLGRLIDLKKSIDPAREPPVPPTIGNRWSAIAPSKSACTQAFSDSPSPRPPNLWRPAPRPEVLVDVGRSASSQASTSNEAVPEDWEQAD